MSRAVASALSLCSKVALERLGQLHIPSGVASTTTRCLSTELFGASHRGQAGPALRQAWKQWSKQPATTVGAGRASLSWRTFSTVTAEASVAGMAAKTAGSSQVWHGYQAMVEGLSDSARRQLVWWLGGCSAWVFSLVVLGGMTRLTRSGLSMTDWKFTGERPPLTQADWEAEFQRYKESPEFKKVHSRMGLQEFKFIFWMEYGHRMWGRLLGVVFAAPGAYFLARGYIRPALAKRLGLLFLMGGSQGLVGWWMVRSGLQEPAHENAIPRVSPYRLAAHLTSAFAIYTTLLWTTLGVAVPGPLSATAGSVAAKAAAALRHKALPLSALIGVTAVSGAFVAGLDAGRAYNDFPFMNGHLIPEEYSSIAGWRNAFENTAAVQLHHRLLAMASLLGVGGLWTYSRALPLHPATKFLASSLAAVTLLQVSLGITTLMTYVPVSLGSAHQAGALTLFSVAVALLHSVRPTNPAGFARLLATSGTPVAAVGVLGIGAAVMYNN